MFSKSTSWSERPSRASIFGSKAVGEPPLMLAISVREAIRDAIARVRRGRTNLARKPRHARARVFRHTTGASGARVAGKFGWCHAVIPAPGGELLRAPLFHTPRNPFRESRCARKLSRTAAC